MSLRPIIDPSTLSAGAAHCANETLTRLVYERVVQMNDHVLDIGANRGEHTAELARIVGVGGVVAASESADNATVPAALIPAFAIGVPGSLATALLLGAFMMHGLTPGPFLFRQNGQVQVCSPPRSSLPLRILPCSRTTRPSGDPA